MQDPDLPDESVKILTEGTTLRYHLSCCNKHAYIF